MSKYTSFEDCTIERIEYYKTNEVGYKIIVPANVEKGFSFPLLYLFLMILMKELA